jgi:hypothetical protein
MTSRPRLEASFAFIEEEEESATSSNQCCVCMDATASTRLAPCLHDCLCHSCALRVVNSDTARCPVCRTPTTGFITISTRQILGDQGHARRQADSGTVATGQVIHRSNAPAEETEVSPTEETEVSPAEETAVSNLDCVSCCVICTEIVLAILMSVFSETFPWKHGVFYVEKPWLILWKVNTRVTCDQRFPTYMLVSGILHIVIFLGPTVAAILIIAVNSLSGLGQAIGRQARKIIFAFLGDRLGRLFLLSGDRLGRLFLLFSFAILFWSDIVITIMMWIFMFQSDPETCGQGLWDFGLCLFFYRVFQCAFVCLWKRLS